MNEMTDTDTLRNDFAKVCEEFESKLRKEPKMKRATQLEVLAALAFAFYVQLVAPEHRI